MKPAPPVTRILCLPRPTVNLGAPAGQGGPPGGRVRALRPPWKGYRGRRPPPKSSGPYPLRQNGPEDPHAVASGAQVAHAMAPVVLEAGYFMDAQASPRGADVD